MASSLMASCCPRVRCRILSPRTHAVRDSTLLFALTAPSLERLKDYQNSYTAATEAAAQAATKVATSASTSGVELTTLDTSPVLLGLAAGVVIVGTGILLATRNSGPNIQGVSPARAIDILANDASAVIIDLRSRAEVNQAGSPDLRSVGKSLVSLPYSRPANTGSEGTVVIGWEDKLRRLSKVSEDSCIVLLSSTSDDASEAAKLVASVFPKQSAIYYVNGGTEGPRGWRESELPWREPLRLGLPQLQSIDLSGLTAGAGKLAGVAAVAGVAAGAIFLFAEIETILEIIGIVGAGQFLISKLIFAEDRQKLFDDLKSLFNDKIGAGDAGEDLKKLASTILDVDTAEEAIQASSAGSSKVGNGKPVRIASASAIDRDGALQEVAATASPSQSGDVPRKSAARDTDTDSTPSDAAVSKSAGVPENVKAAREWIGNWKKKVG